MNQRKYIRIYLFLELNLKHKKKKKMMRSFFHPTLKNFAKISREIFFCFFIREHVLSTDHIFFLKELICPLEGLILQHFLKKFFFFFFFFL